MIVRILRGRVAAEHVLRFREHAQRALLDARQHEGLVVAHVGRQVHSGGSEEVMFLTVWRDMDALYGWIGNTDLLETPVLAGSAVDLLDQYDVQHFEVIDLEGSFPQALLGDELEEESAGLAPS